MREGRSPGSRRRRLFYTAAALACAVLWVAGTFAPPGPTLYVGGRILTMDADNRIVDALATEGERIAAVGGRAELESWAEERDARIVDLRGRTMIPGFVDGHSHFPGSGLLDPLVHLGSPPLGDVTDMDKLIATLEAGADKSRRGDWIVGWGYDDTALAGENHPTRDDLDRVSLEAPVVVFHISMHVAAVNSKGLEVLGFLEDSPDPEGGHLGRDAGGKLDGLLEEEAMRPLIAATLTPSTFDAVLAARAAAATYLAAGVTTAQNGAAQESHVRGLATLSRFGLLPLRLVLWPEGETAFAMLDGSLEVGETDPDWLRIGASKLVADGSIQAYTGWFTKPYHVPPGDDPTWRGYPRIAHDELVAQVARLHEAGRQVAVHGNGDAAIDDILDAFEAALAAHPRDDARHIIVHAQTARPDQLDRMKKLGVIPSFFELHTWYWGDRHRDRFLGPERAARISPLRSAMDRGLRFTLHTDAPVVPMEPLRAVAAAVTRRTASGAVLGESERIDVMTALRAVTIDAAWQMFMEHSVGSLERGKFADLVILDRSPLDDPDHIEDIRVMETIVGGRSVASRPPG